jgi:hypothetical protein
MSDRLETGRAAVKGGIQVQVQRKKGYRYRYRRIQGQRG